MQKDFRGYDGMDMQFMMRLQLPHTRSEAAMHAHTPTVLQAFAVMAL